jgi:hypothetical protein
MKSRIELLMTVARLQEAIGTVGDARAATGDDAHVVGQPGVLLRRSVARTRCAAGAPVSPALERRGRSSRSLIHFAGAGDHPSSSERGQV